MSIPYDNDKIFEHSCTVNKQDEVLVDKLISLSIETKANQLDDVYVSCQVFLFIENKLIKFSMFRKIKARKKTPAIRVTQSLPKSRVGHDESTNQMYESLF